MPYGDANGIMVEMAAEVLPIVKDINCWRASAGQILPTDAPLQTTQEMGFTGAELPHGG